VRYQLWYCCSYCFSLPPKSSKNRACNGVEVVWKALSKTERSEAHHMRLGGLLVSEMFELDAHFRYAEKRVKQC
jgi:hypothetical protein